MKRSPLRKESSKKQSVLKKEAWKVFSKWIRKRDNNTCFTCGRKGEGPGMHAGHYIPRSISGNLLFDEDNVHAQCYRCNIHLSGNADEYALRLGPEIVEDLRLRKRIVKQWTIPELIGIIEKYE